MPDFPRKAWFYIAGIIILGVGLAIWQLLGLELSYPFFLLWGVLWLVDITCELYEIQLVPGHATSAAIAVITGAVLIGGSRLGIAVVCTGTLLAELFLRRPFWRKDPLRYFVVVGFNVSQLSHLSDNLWTHFARLRWKISTLSNDC